MCVVVGGLIFALGVLAAIIFLRHGGILMPQHAEQVSQSLPVASRCEVAAGGVHEAEQRLDISVPHCGSLRVAERVALLCVEPLLNGETIEEVLRLRDELYDGGCRSGLNDAQGSEAWDRCFCNLS